MFKTTLYIMLFLGLFLLTLSAYSAPREVIDSISKLSLQVMDKAGGSAARKSIEEQVDFDILARESLGKHWGRIAARQQQEFKNTLREIIGRTVYPRSPDFFKNATIEIKEEKEEGEKAYIKSLVRHKEKKATVEYWLQKFPSGWKVVDLAISEERWVNNLKEQFNDVIAEKSFAELLKKMKKRLADLKAKKDY